MDFNILPGNRPSPKKAPRTTPGRRPDRFDEIRAEVGDRPKFEAYDEHLVWDSASALVRYGVSPIELYRASGGHSAKYFSDDLRRADMTSFLQSGFVLALSRGIPDLQGYTPRALSAYRPALASIDASFRP